MERIFGIPKLAFLKIGKYKYDKDLVCDYNDLPRPFHSIALITKGCGDFVCDKTIVSVNEGDIIFIPMHSTYMSQWSEDSESISIHFQFDVPTPFPNSYKYHVQKHCAGECTDVKKLFDKIYCEYELSKNVSFSVLSNFYGIMDIMYPKLIFQKILLSDERIEKAINYIELHYNENFSISFLAQYCNMSVSHFHLCIKKQLGCSAIEYKHKICIHHAQLMLEDNPEKSIEDISADLGFSSSIYFREIFKKITGKTPKGYRNSVME